MSTFLLAKIFATQEGSLVYEPLRQVDETTAFSPVTHILHFQRAGSHPRNSVKVMLVSPPSITWSALLLPKRLVGGRSVWVSRVPIASGTATAIYVRRSRQDGHHETRQVDGRRPRLCCTIMLEDKCVHFVIIPPFGKCKSALSILFPDLVSQGYPFRERRADAT